MSGTVYPRQRLGALALLVEHGLPTSAAPAVPDCKLLRITDIQDGVVDWSRVPGCVCSAAKQRRFALRRGDIVFARTGATTGKSFLIRDEPPAGAVFASYLIRVRPNPRKIHPEYLAHYLRTPEYWAQVGRRKSGTAQDGVSSTKLKGMLIPVPPLAEQRHIAAVLDQADEIRRRRRQALGLTAELRRSTFLSLLGDPVTNPQGWPLRRLEDELAGLTSGSRTWAKHCGDTGAPFLRIQNVGRDELLLADLARVNPPAGAEAERTRVQSGDVLLSITADLGRTAVIPPGFGEAFISQHLAILRPRELSPWCLSAFLSSEGGRRQIRQRSHGGVKSGLNFGDIRSMVVPAPPRDSQAHYVAAATSIRAAADRLRAAAAEAEALAASLAQRAFRGELRIPP